MSLRCAYEANEFSEELTLPDDKTIELIMDRYDSEHHAKSLHSDIYFVTLKVDNFVRGACHSKYRQYLALSK